MQTVTCKNLIINEEYKSKVKKLSRKGVVFSTLKWLRLNEVITEFEFNKILLFRKNRNEIAHELLTIILDSEKWTKTEFLTEIRNLHFKINIW